MRSGIKTARAYGRRFSNKAMREHFGWSGKFSKEVHIQANAGNSWANVVLLEATRRLCEHYGIGLQTDLEDFTGGKETGA